MRLPMQTEPVLRGVSHAVLQRGVYAQSNCSRCKSVLTDAIEGIAKSTCWAGCTMLGAEVGADCVVIFGGPEDPLGDIVCPFAGALAGAACNKFGCGNLKTHSGAQKAADWICHQIPDVC